MIVSRFLLEYRCDGRGCKHHGWVDFELSMVPEEIDVLITDRGWTLWGPGVHACPPCAKELDNLKDDVALTLVQDQRLAALRDLVEDCAK